MDPELLDQIVVIANDFAPGHLDSLAERLSQANALTDVQQLTQTLPTNSQRAAFGKLLAVWRKSEDVTPSQIAIGLRAAQKAVDKVRSEFDIEPVWTGPSSSSTRMRRLDQGLLELVEKATSRLTLVTFVAYSIPNLEESLRAAADRGINMRLILESEHESGGQIRFDPLNALNQAIPDADVYYWPNELRHESPSGSVGVLHAKCAIADDRMALISSANLTGSALERNMELGVLVSGGPIPKMISSHFDTLISNGILRPLS